jgi:hypothetical protein
MHMPCARTVRKKQFLRVETLVLTALAAVGPLQAAHAYVDPNSAGPLYQMLFPLFIAIVSTFAALRGIVRRLLSRLTKGFMAAVRGRCVSSETEKPLDPL